MVLMRVVLRYVLVDFIWWSLKYALGPPPPLFWVLSFVAHAETVMLPRSADLAVNTRSRTCAATNVATV